jgi:hypothetical protein
VQLSEIATKSRIGAEGLVKDAALRLLPEDARFRAAVQERIARNNRGKFMDEEDMAIYRRLPREAADQRSLADLPYRTAPALDTLLLQ